jgi:hypothetical protein
MKSMPPSLLRGLLFAGLVAGLTGCIAVTVKTGLTPAQPCDASHDQKTDCCGGDGEPREADGQLPGDPPQGGGPTPGGAGGGQPGGGAGIPGGPDFRTGNPAGNFGSVYTHTGTTTPNTSSSGCFRANQGWDKYFVLGLFAGPYTPPLSGFPNLTNTNNSVNIRVQTCNLTNVFWGTTLQTGIIIHRDDNSSIKKCRTNALQCTFSTKLTTNVYAMSAGYYYRAVVYYKSSTLPTGQTNITVDWNYE